jgi:hypothetical protein
MFIDDRYENRFNQMRRQHLTKVRYERVYQHGIVGINSSDDLLAQPADPRRESIREEVPGHS